MLALKESKGRDRVNKKEKHKKTIFGCALQSGLMQFFFWQSLRPAGESIINWSIEALQQAAMILSKVCAARFCSEVL